MTLIRHAAPRDRDWLRAAYLDMLTWLEGQGYLILPTEENADWMVDEVFLPAIREDRGVFVGCDEGGNPIAALFWVVDVPLVEVRVPTATSYGQWVSAAHRGQGVIPEMVRVVASRLKDAGIERVLDMAHTGEAVAAAEACGFEVETNVVTLNL